MRLRASISEMVLDVERPNERILLDLQLALNGFQTSPQTRSLGLPTTRSIEAERATLGRASQPFRSATSNHSIVTEVVDSKASRFNASAPREVRRYNDPQWCLRCQLTASERNPAERAPPALSIRPHPMREEADCDLYLVPPSGFCITSRPNQGTELTWVGRSTYPPPRRARSKSESSPGIYAPSSRSHRSQRHFQPHFRDELTRLIGRAKQRPRPRSPGFTSNKSNHCRSRSQRARRLARLREVERRELNHHCPTLTDEMNDCGHSDTERPRRSQGFRKLIEHPLPETSPCQTLTRR